MTQVHALLKVWGCGLLAGGITLLSACGGGGGTTPDGTNKDTPFRPQSVSGSYSVIETRKAVGNVISFKLNVVDLGTGTAVRSFDIVGDPNGDDYPSRDWRVVSQYKLDADGLGFHQDGASQLAVIQGGKVMLLDLSGNTPGTARQLSSISDACEFDRHETHLSADGRHAWLRVSTKGPDNTCGEDNPAFLVSLDMAASDAAIASGSNQVPLTGKDIVLALHNTGEQVKGLLVIDRDTRSLSVYSNDLKTKQYDVSVTGHVVQPGDAARELTRSPVDARQALVQVGAKVYLADWNGSKLSLGNPVTTLSQAQAYVAPPVTAKDNTYYYLAEGNNGQVIAANGARARPVVFPPERGTVRSIWPTSTGVVVNQTQVFAYTTTPISSGAVTTIAPGASGALIITSPTSGTVTASRVEPAAVSAPVTAPVSTLWFIDRNTAVPHEVVHTAGSVDFQIDAVSGDDVYFSQPAAARSRWRELYKVNAADRSGQQTVASGVSLVEHVLNPHRRAGQESVVELMWCKPASPELAASYQLGCAKGTLTGHDPASGQTIELGKLDDTVGAGLASHLFGVQNTWSGRNSLLILRKEDSVGNYAGALYAFNPATGSSLKKLTGQP